MSERATKAMCCSADRGVLDACNDSTSSPGRKRRLSGSCGSPAAEQFDVGAVTQSLVHELRQENPSLPGACIVNDDLARAFVERYARMVSELGVERAQPRVVFHGTARSNFRAIIAGNLRVPDGDKVMSVSGRSTYGLGIYVSTSFDLALMYGRKHAAGHGRSELPTDASGGPPVVFVCLSLPGRQHVSAPPADTACREVRPGFDSHVSADRGGQISVYFDSSQLLPCFLSERGTLVCAQEAAVRAVNVLHKATHHMQGGQCSSAAAGDVDSTTTADGVAQVLADTGETGEPSAAARIARAAEPDTKSVQRFGGGGRGPATTRTRGGGIAASAPDADDASAPPPPQPSAAPNPPRPPSMMFATADWDGVAKRVRYS